MPYLLGEMYNELTTVQVLLKDIIRIANNDNFQAVNENGNAMLTRKTLVANACINTVRKAMEISGGQSFFRSMELERLFRDAQAGITLLFRKKAQQYFTGEFLLEGGGSL